MSGAWGRSVGILLLCLFPAALIKLLEQGVRTACDVAIFADYNGTPGLALDDRINVSLASTAITVAVGLLLLAVMAPLAQGVLRWFYRRTAGEDEPVSAVFHYFETARDYFKAVWLRLLVDVKLFLWALLLYGPLAVLTGMWGAYLRRAPDLSTGYASTFFFLLAALWAVLAAVLLGLLALRYLLAPWLLAEHPDWKARKAIRQGVRYARGYKGSLFTFGLSFAGWWSPAILAVLICLSLPFCAPYYRLDLFGSMGALALAQGLLLFYVGPYMLASFAMYGRYLIQLGGSGGPPEEEAPPADLTREYEPSGELPRVGGAEPEE